MSSYKDNFSSTPLFALMKTEKLSLQGINRHHRTEHTQDYIWLWVHKTIQTNTK